MIKECETMDEFYEVLKRSFEGCNYVNRVVVEGCRKIPKDSCSKASFPKYSFASLEGFVSNQKVRQGRIRFETDEKLHTDLGIGNIDIFLHAVAKHYEDREVTDLSAKLYQDSTPADLLELKVKAK